MHKTLLRQLKRFQLDVEHAPEAEDWQDFLERVDRMYKQADQDRYLMERSLAISSSEMQELYEDLKRRSETALASERDRLQSLMENVADGILSFDEEGMLESMNPAAQHIFGFDQEEISDQFIGTLIPDDIVKTIEGFAKENGADTQSNLRYETSGIRRDGSIFPMDISISQMRDQGRRLFIASLRDITERKRIELEMEERKQFFETLVQNNPVAIVITETDGRISEVNPRFAKMFGFERTEVLGRDLDELIGGEGGYQEMDKVGEVFRRTQTKRQRKDGSFVDVEILGVPVEVKGNLKKYLVLYHDISEHVHSQEILQEAKEAAEEATRAKSEFLANMSHEIRTPLNAVVGMTGLLMDTALDDEQMDFIETIRGGGEVLLEVVNDILDFSKIEAGKLDLETQPFSIRDSVETALDLITNKATEKKLELAYLIEEPTPLALVGDVTRLRQILVNLLSNAVKFTDAGEIVLEVHSKALDDGHVELEFSVRDTGIGIPEDRLNRLFKSFSQVDSSTTRKYGGTGLGLTISKQLAEMMGGRMWVESKPGEGSTFFFTIIGEIADGPAPLHASGEQAELSGRRILIVDDSATNRKILSKQVESWGMQAHVFASPKEALAAVESDGQFDVAILDMQMPEMDGLMLAQEVRQLRTVKQLPMIMLTSLGHQAVNVNGNQFSAALSKPIKPSQLFDALVNVLTELPIKVQKQKREENQIEADLAEKHPLRILLAEDNLVNQKVAVSLLGRMGYRPDVVANGAEALRAIERQKYDVILMDVQMPEMDGREATRRIRSDFPMDAQPQVVAMTANALQGDREAFLADGMDDYVSKPVSVEELKRALKQAHQQTVRAGVGVS